MRKSARDGGKGRKGGRKEWRRVEKEGGEKRERERGMGWEERGSEGGEGEDSVCVSVCACVRVRVLLKGL